LFFFFPLSFRLAWG